MKKGKITYLPVGILTGLTVVSGAILTGAPVRAEWSNCTTTNGVTKCEDTTTGMKQATAHANASVTVSAACGFYNASDTEKSATMTPGNYDNTSFANFSTMTAVCNNPGGLAVYAVGYSPNASGVDTYGNNNMTGVTTHATIPTGTLTSGGTSQWAMKLTGATGTSYDPVMVAAYTTYAAVPAQYTKVATFVPQTTYTAGAQITTSYAVYASTAQSADTYVGKVKYTVVNPQTASAVNYSLTYDKGNNNDTVTLPSPNPQTGAAGLASGGSTVAIGLSDTVPTRTGYVFDGWCSAMPTTAANVDTCSGATYAAGDDITVSVSGTTSVAATVYAIWHPAS